MEEEAAGFPPGSATSGSGNYGGPLVTYKCCDSHKRQLAMYIPNCDVMSFYAATRVLCRQILTLLS